MSSNQPPNYPPGQYPPHYPQMYPQMGQYMTPQQQAQQQQQQQPQPPQQGTPSYSQPGGTTAPGAVPPNFMSHHIKQEPGWGDGRYGGTGQHLYPPMMTPMMQQEMEARNANAPTPSAYTQQPAGGSGGGGGPSSVIAQHFATQPHMPHQGYPTPSSQSSQLQQLLQQHTSSFPPGGPASQQFHQQQQMVEQQRMQLQAMRLQQQQQQAAYQEYQAQQQQQQQQQQLAAQQQQQQQSQPQSQQSQQPPQSAARPSQPSSVHLQPPEPMTGGFPPSASSTHSDLHRGMGNLDWQAEMQFSVRPPSYRALTPQKMEEFEKLTTGELCIMGRELVSDLNQKTSSLAHMLKKVMERRPLMQGENPNHLSDHCSRNLEKMLEIRQIIEKRRGPTWKRLTGDEYIEMMLDDSELPPEDEMSEEQKAKRAELAARMPTVMSKTPPNEGDQWYQGRWIPQHLFTKYMIFEENKLKIKALTCELKKLAWNIEVTSPGHLKRVDQTKISKKREEARD